MNSVLQRVLSGTPVESFEAPSVASHYDSLPPPLRGKWQGGESFYIDKFSGKLATEFTPDEAKIEYLIPNVHDTLYWVDKENPIVLKAVPGDSDGQFANWEASVQNWWAKNYTKFPLPYPPIKPTGYDDVHVEGKMPIITFQNPTENLEVFKSSPLSN